MEAQVWEKFNKNATSAPCFYMVCIIGYEIKKRIGRLIYSFMLLAIVGWLVPSRISVYLIFVHSSQFHIEDECRIARYASRGIATLAISEVVGDDNLAYISLDHVHYGSGKAINILIYSQEGRNVCSLVESVCAITLAEHVALRIGRGRYEPSQVVNANRVIVEWTFLACTTFDFLDIHEVVVVGIGVLHLFRQVECYDLAPPVCACVGKVGNGIDIQLIAFLPVVIFAFTIALAA